jgi:hypothetical protein
MAKFGAPGAVTLAGIPPALLLVINPPEDWPAPFGSGVVLSLMLVRWTRWKKKRGKENGVAKTAEATRRTAVTRWVEKVWSLDESDLETRRSREAETEESVE